jgi:hypothetical protein
VFSSDNHRRTVIGRRNTAFLSNPNFITAHPSNGTNTEQRHCPVKTAP